MAILMQVLAGLIYSLTYWVIVAGLALKFNNLKTPDFAHASLYMLAAYITYSVVLALPNDPLTFFLAMIIAAIVVAVLGGLVEMYLLRRIYFKADHSLQVVLTFSLIFIFADVVRFGWGLTPKLMPKPAFLQGSFSIGELALPNHYLLIFAVGLAVALGLWYVLYRTKTGRIIRAMTDDHEMASGLGINVQRWTTGIFMAGSALGGLGGALATLQIALGPGMESAVLINLFIIIVIGGIGSLAGTLLGTLILGQVVAFGAIYLSEWSMALPYLLMAIVLIVRPWGLLGKPPARR